MKKKSIAALLLALTMCASLCACGGKDSETTTATSAETVEETTAAAETEAPAAAASTQSWGEFSVDVPADWEFKTGDTFDSNDARYFSVKKSTFSYFDFSADGEENIKKHYEYNKNTYTNEQTDFKETYGDAEWEGFQYSDGFGGYGIEAFTTIDGVMIRVASAGFKYDSEEVKTVLGSLKHTGAAAEATTEAAASEEKTEETTEETTTEEATTEEEIAYAKYIEMTASRVNIPEGYEEMKDAAPSQYVMSNNETGGKVTYTSGSGSADETVEKIMSGLEFEKKDYEFKSMPWIGATSDSLYCFATQIGEFYLAITIDFGATMEEMETLCKGIQVAE